MRKLFGFSILLLILFGACNLIRPGKVTPTPTQFTKTPPGDTASAECAFVWARESLIELSQDFKKELKNIQPQANGYAEAYGENCINNQGEAIRFLAMETDFNVTLKVKDLNDEQKLGELIEQVLVIVSKFPVEETPGPQPGYVGITFEARGDEIQLWFIQTDAKAALEDGLHGQELFKALQAK